MKLLKGLLYGVIGLLTVFSLLLAACAFVPGLTPMLSGALYLAGFSRNPDPGTWMEMLAEADPGVDGEGEASQRGEITLVTPHHSMPGTADGTKYQPYDESEDFIAAPQHSVPGSGAGANDQPYYVRPEEAQMMVPQELAGRTGYIPVREDNEQLGEEEAERIREQYTYGETGDALTFDETFYPYYGMMNENQKKLYRQIYANAQAVNGSFNPVVPVSMQELKQVFMAVFHDHPELFWLESSYKGRFSNKGECVEIVLSFYDLIDDLEAEKNHFESQAEEILSVSRGLSSDQEKEQYIHDTLIDQVSYDLLAAYHQSAYSALVRGASVCAGYARAFQYLMIESGIPCYYCTGYAGENHAWNIVRLDGEFYNVDTTWDDGESGRYRYFNKTDQDFSTTHRREDLSVYLPACHGTAYAGTQESLMQQPEGRSLEEAGFTEEDVLYDMESYFLDCGEHLIKNNGSGEFQNVVDNEELLLQIEGIYDSDQYMEAYLSSVLAVFGAEGYDIHIEAEPLEKGRFLMDHRISFR